MVWGDGVQRGVVCCGVVWRVVQCGVEWSGVAWSGVVWCGVVCVSYDDVRSEERHHRK